MEDGEGKNIYTVAHKFDFVSQFTNTSSLDKMNKIEFHCMFICNNKEDTLNLTIVVNVIHHAYTYFLNNKLTRVSWKAD